MRIMIMGTGGIGGYYGARLHQAGADVFFIARGKHLEAIQNQGLKVTSVKGAYEIPTPQASSNPMDAGKVDVAIFATKAWDIESAGEMMAPALHDDSIVIHFQNGVDTADRLASVIDRRKLIGGVAYGVMNIVEPGVIDNPTQAQELIYGAYDANTSETLKRFHEFCEKSVFKCQLVENIETHIWSKFLFICAFSGITSLTRSPIGPIVNDPQLEELFQSCMQEIKTIADRLKIKLDPNIVEDRLKFAHSLELASTSSMLRDLLHNNRMELDALNGRVSRFGKDLGIETPVNDFIAKALKLQKNGKQD